MTDRVVHLSERKCQLLADVLEIHLEGIEEAKHLTTVDPSIKSVDELTEYMAGLDEDATLLQEVLEEVKVDVSAGS